MRVYISGPMTGFPGLNKKAFRDMARQLLAMGYEPVNPIWVKVDKPSWDTYMQADLALLDKADAILMLDGWQESEGARIERRYAKKHGKQLFN